MLYHSLRENPWNLWELSLYRTHVIIRYIFKHNGGYTPYNPSFREEITTYAAQVLKLTHYKVCLQLSVRRIIGNIGLVKDLDTGTYYYVVQDTSAQKKNEFFHFTSEELNSE